MDDKKEIIIRSFADEDTFDCCRLIERCVQDYQGISKDAYEKFRSRTHEQNFTDYIKRNCRFIAVLDDRIIGMGGTEGNMVKLMYVDPNHRLIGVGRKIHEFLEDYQKLQGIQEVTIDASINSIPFYLKLGYREIEHTKFYLTGSEVNQCIMKKSIVTKPIRVVSFSIPEYKIDTEPDFQNIGMRVDNLIGKEFGDGQIAIRCIGSMDHPPLTLDKLIQNIIESGTDRYDPARKSILDEGFEDYKFDIHALECYIENGKLKCNDNHIMESVTGEIFYDFYHNAKLDRGYSVKIDIMIIYNMDFLLSPLKVNLKANNPWEKHLFRFRNPNEKNKAILGIVKLLNI